MTDGIPKLKNEVECTIQWNNIRLLLNGLINHMVIYAELFDKDDPFESYMYGRTQLWIDLFKACQKEITEGPE